MELDEVTKILNDCTREELRDHAFGGTEIVWLSKTGKIVANGYFGGSHKNVSFYTGEFFEGEDAHKLRECGTLGHVERNDETGPDTYTEGEVMPGLSKGDVFHELTGNYMDES